MGWIFGDHCLDGRLIMKFYLKICSLDPLKFILGPEVDTLESFYELYTWFSSGHTGELLWTFYWAQQRTNWRCFVNFILGSAVDILESFCKLFTGLKRGKLASFGELYTRLSRGHIGELLWTLHLAQEGTNWRAFLNFILGSAGDTLESFCESYSELKRGKLAIFCELYTGLSREHTGEILWTLYIAQEGTN